MQSIRFTLPKSALETKLVWVRLRLRLVDILVKMWLLKAFFLVILPVPVSLKRFLALELVFIFVRVRRITFYVLRFIFILCNYVQRITSNVQPNLFFCSFRSYG